MPSFTQDTRFLSLTTTLGDKVLLLERFTGFEAISRPFIFTLDLLSEESQVDFRDIVGTSATIHLKTEDGMRHIHGFVSQFSQGPITRRFCHYQAVLVPWLWNLTRTANCRIFQNDTVPDILTQVFQELGYRDVDVQLTGQYKPREYCVQYRETDFHFVSRLMEAEGIFYFFTHTAQKHVMVLGDSPNAFQPCPGATSYPYEPCGGWHEGDAITHWHHEQGVRTAQYSLTDYNFETPANNLEVNVSTTVTTGKNPRLEIYDYPGHYLNRPGGERYARLHMEEEEAQHTHIDGASRCRAFVPGYCFDLTEHYRSGWNTTYFLTSVTHEAASNLLNTHEAVYSNTFTCLPRSIPFRPPCLTPRPFVRGPQTAVVVGPASEEIHTDKYGRIKVQFHWDRQGQKNEHSSCWIRVAQSWAGKQWGAIFLPRSGQEVVVDFLEGDPDQPLVTGAVYNAENMPPYELPAHKTQSGLKTRSSPRGGVEDFNELRFEDNKGAEEVYLHAQKDFTRLVEHDDSLEVRHDQTISITGERTETVKEGNESVTIAQGNRMVNVEMGHDTHVITQGNRTVQLDMGNDSLTLKMGNQTTKLHLGKSTTETMQGIELKVGANSIVIDQAGITLKGIMIKLEGAALTQVKAPMVQVNADGMLMLKGGITMIG